MQALRMVAALGSGTQCKPKLGDGYFLLSLLVLSPFLYLSDLVRNLVCQQAVFFCFSHHIHA